ncbi:NAD-dependent epimerase/dehydratase family protein [Oleidesulfovibrio alaskensis]|uniref:NAD-dependent epimerase/dehydratase family protein n=1 Tax=Oleidesulfovibrio alaskensis TaxID=58180 RepID=UPI001A5466F6|nr:NAD-dependent epimerase/dehydratase family protein [Oleidesulfovibrio alaskensis]MBL3583024.1 NAD-dependent epimerase/dehydratase family protein [Oleidesulfovibrio alaskensis]
MMVKTVLVTGVNGFIGSHVAALLGKSHRVYGTGGAPACSVPLAGYRQMVLPDQQLAAFMRQVRPDVVVHCAGRGSIPFSVNHPAEDFDAGPRLVAHVLDSMRRAAVPARFFFPSSAAVYGNPERLPVSEDAPLCPVSPYGCHKVLSEKLISQYHSLYGIEYVVLRVFSCYGEGLSKQLLWDAAVKACAGRVELSGTGEETRDFIHVHDLARLAELLMLRDVSCVTLNAASGRQVSVKELAGLLMRGLEADVPVLFSGALRQGDPLRWQADVARMQSLGFEPHISLEEGVRRFARWFRQQGARRNGS